MVNEEIILRVPIGYRTGYKDGVAAAAGVLQLEADMNLTKSIPAPVVPELNLPYTDEACAPLLLEEFPESDDEGFEDDVDLDVEDGSGVKAALAGAETAKDNQNTVVGNIELD